MSETYYLTTDNAFTRDFVDVIGGADLSGAAVSVTVTDASGTQVTGEAWPLTMTYVGTTTTDMDGNTYTDAAGATQTRYRFRATLIDTLSMTAQKRYTGTVSFNAGAGLQLTEQVSIVAKTKTDTN